MKWLKNKLLIAILAGAIAAGIGLPREIVEPIVAAVVNMATASSPAEAPASAGELEL